AGDRARLRGAAPTGTFGALPRRHRRGARTARFGLVRAAPDDPARADDCQPESRSAPARVSGGRARAAGRGAVDARGSRPRGGRRAAGGDLAARGAAAEVEAGQSLPLSHLRISSRYVPGTRSMCIARALPVTRIRPPITLTSRMSSGSPSGGALSTPRVVATA